ncbi:MAG TPA: adenylosuccinate synthetase [Candidatus Altiarchaeales archaeon]|nr:adenylosuccinate synthetase [Candidatus Altiarchaeales archaeon]
MVSIVVGGHYGDEGKGKMVAYLAVKDDPDVICRAGVGTNAGHTIHVDGKKYGLRMITCGFVNPKPDLMVGAGVLVDPEVFLNEIEVTDCGDRAYVDRRCAIIEKKHKDADRAGGGKIGTTGSGCGPANADRVNRVAKLAQEIDELKDYVVDVPMKVNEAIDSGKEVLVEASQGFGLSLYYGNYPYVTSKDTSASTACADVGIGPTRVDEVYVIYKAYMSRVGKDPYVKPLTDEDVAEDELWTTMLSRAEENGFLEGSSNEKIAAYLGEVGTVTGRPRKIAAFDMELAKYSSKVNGATQVCLTCLDKLFPKCYGATTLEKLGGEALAHVKKIEGGLGIPVSLISTGPDAKHVVDLRGQ